MTGTAQTVLRTELTAAAAARCQSLYVRAKATLYDIAPEEFESWLLAIARKYVTPEATQREAEDLLDSLRVEDLALARACAGGHERAWVVFMARFRELLYDVALGITRESSEAKDLADSLYADLYGMTERDGRRVSKLASYTGRGSLEGWLRTVLAQEFVNRYRSKKRLVSLEEEEEAGAQFAAPAATSTATVDPKVDEAVAEALSELDSESRAILAAYYLDGHKLAEIGRMMGFHEATASRKVERATKALRKAVREGLLRRGLSKRQIEEALETDVRDLNVSVRKQLTQEKGG